MRRLLLAGLLAALGPTAVAAEPPRLSVPFERYTLPNGLTVILAEDHRSPQVVVNLWFRVGSKDERAGRTGFAHLFEHLMFMGTRAVPNGQFDELMEAAGGQNNASTSEDRTNYFESGPANLLETFLFLEGDRLGTLADDMTQEKLDLQRDVVRNERRQSYENRPYGRVALVLPEKLYPDGHPYHHPVIGSHEDLEAARIADVKDFFRSYYVASNASLVVAGDFQPAEAKKLVARYLGKLPKRPVPPHLAAPPATLARSERVVVTDSVQLEQATLAWISPPAFGEGDAACDLLAAVLGGGKSSRLWRALVHDRKLADAVQVEQHGNRHGGSFVVVATALPGHTAAELEEAIAAELRKLEAAPPDAREVERARTFVETDLLEAVERPLGMADMLNTFEYFFGDPGELPRRLLTRYEQVTPEGVAAEARAVLGRPHVSVHVVPAPEVKR